MAPYRAWNRACKSPILLNGDLFNLSGLIMAYIPNSSLDAAQRNPGSVASNAQISLCCIQATMLINRLAALVLVIQLSSAIIER